MAEQDHTDVPPQATFSTPLTLPLSPDELSAINAYLSPLKPQAILIWALAHLPRSHQTTAFGLTGLVQLDMLSKLTSDPPPLIFLDTLYHFPETLELVEEVKRRYGREVLVYKPDGCKTAEEFEKKHGERLWEVNEMLYDYLVKVEPGHRAYRELDVKSVITGRRASQGGSRASLQVLEVDSTGLLKLNPLVSWSFAQVQAYVMEHNVPYNKLLDQGYRSVGDWHSTAKSGDGDRGERAGRWAGRTDKTECGLHEDYFKMKARALEAQAETTSTDGNSVRLAQPQNPVISV